MALEIADQHALSALWSILVDVSKASSDHMYPLDPEGPQKLSEIGNFTHCPKGIWVLYGLKG